MIYGFKLIHPLLKPQAIGHGIPSSLLDKVLEATKQFFALPLEEKHKYF
jgi:isopenicillin N synthase-like dioxygenase